MEHKDLFHDGDTDVDDFCLDQYKLEAFLCNNKLHLTWRSSERKERCTPMPEICACAYCSSWFEGLRFRVTAAPTHAHVHE